MANAPHRLAKAVAEIVLDEEVRACDLVGYDDAIRRLKVRDGSPSLNAAYQILEILSARRRGCLAFAVKS